MQLQSINCSALSRAPLIRQHEEWSKVSILSPSCGDNSQRFERCLPHSSVSLRGRPLEVCPTTARNFFWQDVCNDAHRSGEWSQLVICVVGLFSLLTEPDHPAQNSFESSVPTASQSPSLKAAGRVEASSPHNVTTLQRRLQYRVRSTCLPTFTPDARPLSPKPATASL